MEHSTLYRDDNYIDEKIIGDEESLLIFGALKEQPWRKLDYFMVISLLRGRRQELVLVHEGPSFLMARGFIGSAR